MACMTLGAIEKEEAPRIAGGSPLGADKCAVVTRRRSVGGLTSWEFTGRALGVSQPANEGPGDWRELTGCAWMWICTRLVGVLRHILGVIGSTLGLSPKKAPRIAVGVCWEHTVGRRTKCRRFLGVKAPSLPSRLTSTPSLLPAISRSRLRTLISLPFRGCPGSVVGDL